MYDENQIVKVKWNNTNKSWYESKGYIFTKRYDIFDVFAKDLSPKSSAKIKAICDYCGKEYITQFAMITNGRKIISKDCCSKCTGIKTSEVSIKRRAEKAYLLAKEICDKYGYKLLFSPNEYHDIKQNIKFICPIHGEQEMMLDNLIRGHKCRKCSYEDVGNNLKYSSDYIKNEIEKINGNELLNSKDYKDVTNHNLRIKCKCGNIFTTSFANYTKHGVNTCFSCSCKESVGEKIIRTYLIKNNINFVQEKRFVDCRDMRSLPFDFYLPTYNTIIKFDGQHYYEPTYNQEHYERTVRHDKIKNNYCNTHNINLIRIPYWEGNKIEEI